MASLKQWWLLWPTPDHDRHHLCARTGVRPWVCVDPRAEGRYKGPSAEVTECADVRESACVCGCAGSVHTWARSVLQHQAAFTPGSGFKSQLCSPAESPENVTPVKWADSCARSCRGGTLPAFCQQKRQPLLLCAVAAQRLCTGSHESVHVCGPPDSPSSSSAPEGTQPGAAQGSRARVPTPSRLRHLAGR